MVLNTILIPPKKISAFLVIIVTLTILSPPIHAAETSETKQENTIFTHNRFLFENPYDGSSEAIQRAWEKKYITSWYYNFGPKFHVEDLHLKNGIDAKISQFLKSTEDERIKTSRKYHDLITELFIRSAMMFRLAENGWSTAYLKEAEQIFFKLADLDEEFKKCGLNFETRKNHIDLALVEALRAGTEEMSFHSLKTKATINEVLTSISDLAQRESSQSRIQTQYNSMRPDTFHRFKLGVIIFSILLGINGLPDQLAMSHALGVSPSNLALVQLFLSGFLSIYAVQKIIPRGFKGQQQYLFDQTALSCSKLIKGNTTQERAGEIH